MILTYFLCAIIGYLLGSLNSAILVSKYIFGMDIRSCGSGNAGATNTLRTFGIWATVMVVLGDALKGIVGALVGLYLAGNGGLLLGGLFAILGHNWPVYFNFKGGKGILTSFTVLLTIDWRIGLIVGGIAIGSMVITRIVSLGSLLGCVLLPIAVWFIPSLRGIDKVEFLIFSIIISVIAAIRHRANIVRLINGTESKVGQKVKAS